MSKCYTIKGHTIESVRNNLAMNVEDVKICEVSILPFGKVITPIMNKLAEEYDKSKSPSERYNTKNLSQYGIGDVLTREDNPDRYGLITKESIDEHGYIAATRLCIIKLMQMVTAESDINKIAILCSTADFIDTRDSVEFECTFKEIIDTLYPEYDITVMFLYEERRGELDDLIDDEDD